jgi:topoisomerase-4 subunit A
LEPLQYEIPEEEIPETIETPIDLSDENINLDDDGQITLTLE